MSQKLSAIIQLITVLQKNKYTGTLIFDFYEGSVSNKYSKKSSFKLVK